MDSSNPLPKSINPPNLSIISDRAASIAITVSEVFPYAFPGLCCRHLMVNLRLKSKKGKMFEQLWWKTCKAYRVSDFEERMSALTSACPNINDTLVDIGYHRWSRAHCSGQRYNMMTSNSAESINALTRHARKLPITKLVEFYRELLQKWYYSRRQAGGELQHTLTKWAEDKVNKRITLSAKWIVTGVNGHVFEVDDRRKKGVVDLVARTCSCRVWDLSGLPCGHLIAVSRFLKQSDVSHWALGWFTRDYYRATYEDSVNPVPVESEWEIPDDFVPTQPPLMNKRQAGRPREVKRIPSRDEEVTDVSCSRCGMEGHHRDQCKRPMPSQLCCYRCGREGHNGDHCSSNFRSQQSTPHPPGSHMMNDEYHDITFVDAENFRNFVVQTTGQASQNWDFDLNEP